MSYKYTRAYIDPDSISNIVDLANTNSLFTIDGIWVYMKVNDFGVEFLRSDTENKVRIKNLHTRELAEPEIDYKAKYEAVCAELEELQKVHNEIKEALS